MKTFGLWTSRDRTNISVFGKDEPGEDHAWLITYSDHPPLWLLQPRSLRVPIIWSVLDNPSSLYSLSPLGNFVPCTKHVDLWKLLLHSLYFFGIVEFLMHSMEILSQLYSPILLWATQVYFLPAQAPIFQLWHAGDLLYSRRWPEPSSPFP